MATIVGRAQIDLIAITTQAKAQVLAFSNEMKTKLLAASKVEVQVKANTTRVDSEIKRIKEKFSDLQNELKLAVSVDVSALQAVLASLGKQIADLRAVEQALRNLGNAGAGGNGGGAGGGSPGRGLNQYLAELKAWQTELKAGTATTQQFEAGLRTLQATLQADLAALRNLGTLTQEDAAKMNQIKAALGSVNTELGRLSREASQSGVAQLGRDMQVAQSQYQRGAMSLREYLREMQRIQAAGTAMAGSLQAGSREAQQLERVMSALNRGAAQINDQSIVKLRADLAAARSEYERATAAAGRFGDTRAATRAYEQAMAGLEQRIRAVGERTNVTASQMRSLNQLSAQLGSQRNALQGSFTPIGLAGNIRNALQSLPQFAAQLGGSLGAAFNNSQMLVGSLGALGNAAGPLGIALGVVATGLVAITAAMSKAVTTAADFEQSLADIKALTQPTTEQLAELKQATFDIGTPLGVGAREAAGAVLELNRAGLSTTETIGGGLKGALDLAGAAGVNAAAGGKMAVAAMTAFGQTAADMPKIADVYASFANRTFLDAQHLQDAIAAVGPVAQQAGLDFQQFAGYMATLAQGGFKRMTDAGTSLKTMLLSLMAPADTAQKALDRLGYTTYDAKGNFKGLDVVLAELGDKLNSLSQEDRNRYLKEIFGTDAIRAGTILLKAGNAQIAENIRLMGLSGEAARVATERNNSYNGQLKILKANWEGLVITAGEKLLPTLTKIVKGMTAVLEGVKNNNPAIMELKTNLGLLAVAIAAVRAQAILAAAQAGLGALRTALLGIVPAAASALASLTGVSGGITTMTGLMAALRTSISLTAASFSALAAPVAAVAAAIGVYANHIISDINRVNDAINQATLDSSNALMAKVNALIKAGDALSMAQAKYLLAQDNFLKAQQGDIVGRDIAGNAIYKVNPQALELARTRLAAAQAELKAAQASSGQGGLVGQGPLLPGQVRVGAPSDYGEAILKQSLLKTGVHTADAVVDYCAQWVRLTLGRAQPKIANYINSIFQKDSDGDGLTTAKDAARNAKAAGLYRQFTQGSEKDLKPGDTVFYTEGGENHVGIYIGNGMVRGNNRVSFKQTGNPVGDVKMSSLGHVSGYMRADDLNAAARGGQSATQASDPNAPLKKALAEGEHLIKQYGAALASGNKEWIAKAKIAVDSFRSLNKGAWAALKADYDKVVRGTTGSTSTPVTASSIDAMARYKKALEGMSVAELETRKAAAIANNEKEKTRALLAELHRRENQHAAALKISGTELVKFRTALKGKSDEQLKGLLTEERVKKTAAAYSAVQAEITRRHNADEAAQRRATAATQAAAEKRANLVREIRQAISVFALQDKQHKVTEASQLAFNNRMEDFRAKVLKLPSALQKGTEALFAQAKALSEGATAHMKTSGVIKLAGIALDEYEKKVSAMKDSELAAAKKAEKKSDNLQKQSIIQHEINRRAEERVNQDKANTASAEALSNKVRKLNEDFAVQVKQGKVTESSLTNYRQGLRDVQTALDKLPPACRASTQALIDNGSALQGQGQGVVNRRQELEKLKGAVVNWSLAELEAARARVVAAGSDAEKLKLIDAQIAKIKTLSDAQAEQAHAESLLSQAGANTQDLQGQYEARKAAAKGNLAELYQIELEFGGKLVAAQNAEADAQAKRDSAAVRERFGKLLDLAGISAERRTQLETDRDRELAAIETRRLAQHASNLVAANTNELQAKKALDDAVQTIDRQTRDQIRKNNLESLQRRTADLEAELNQELSAEGLTEMQKFQIRERYQGQLVAAKAAEVQQSREIELQAEEDRFNDAVTAASERLGATQAFLDAKTKLEAEHSSNVGRINKRFDDDQHDYALRLEQETARAKTSAAKEFAGQQLTDAKKVIEEQTGNLSEMTASRRKAARDELDIWRATYAALGDAGADAVAEIDKALKNLTEADKKALEGAAKGIVDPSRIQSDTATKQGRLSKPDDSEAAREQAIGRYAELLNNLRDGLSKAQEGLREFEGVADSALTPDEVKVRDGLRATVAAYQQQIPLVEKAATDAGNAAAAAYTQAQSDQAAESALALAEVQYQLAQQEGRDGGPAYKAGLQAALAYWKGRLTGLTLGTPEYTQALQKIVDLEGKITNLKGSNTLVDSLKGAASVLGKNSPLQASLSAGLDGLAAYFAAGGKAGKQGAILQGAAAFVGGLVDVFRTGDEDIDKVANTFVSGLQSTLSQLAQGNWMGAIISGVSTVVSTIVDIFQGGANSARKARDQIKEVTRDVKFFDLGKYAKVVSRGGFWGWLGFKKAEIDQESVDIARSLGDAIYNAITSGMMDGIRAGKASFDDLGIDLKKALGDQILQGLIDGFMRGAVMQGVLQPFLDSYVEAMKSGNAQALAAAAEGMQQAAVTANGQLKQFYEGVLVPISQRLGTFGSDKNGDGTGTGSGGSLFGNAPGVQLGIPHIEVSLPENALKPLSDLANAIPALTQAGDKLSAAADRLSAETGGADGATQLAWQQTAATLQQAAQNLLQPLRVEIPPLTVTLPDTMLTAMDGFSTAVPIFDQASRRLEAIVDRWERGSGQPPALTGNGGLA